MTVCIAAMQCVALLLSVKSVYLTVNIVAVDMRYSMLIRLSCQAVCGSFVIGIRAVFVGC